MSNQIIYKLIKTECGRAKYHRLSLKKDVFSRLRLIWFILIASIRDLNKVDSL